MGVRQPAVAGKFYPANREALIKELKRDIPEVREKRKVSGVLSPHAGYIFSGSVAGAVFASVEIPDDLIILSPNHTGLGSPVSIMASGSWATPLGEVAINPEIARDLINECSYLEVDESAHNWEHSLEVQLPFLQYIKGEFSFVPICIGTSDLEALLDLGRAMAVVAKKTNREILFVASSDMTHYESVDSAREKDAKAIEKMEELDPEGLYKVVRRHNITMCGYGPAVAVMKACREMGATVGELIRYTNSGEVTGDFTSVVAYAGFVFY